MKSHIIALCAVFLLSSCGSHQRNINSRASDSNLAPYDGPIIDMHIHAFHEGSQMLGMTCPPTLRNETFEGAASAEELKELTFAKFQEHNIVKALVTDARGWAQEAPSIILNAKTGDIDELKDLHKNGKLQAIAEMTPFFSGKLATDPSQIPYFELAQELDVPIGFHVFPGGPNNGFHLMPEALGGMRAYNANPLQLEDILFEFPNIRLFIMHGGWPYVDDVKALLYNHANLYVDISVINWTLPQDELNAYLKSLIDAGFGDRIMYGSDQIAFPQVITIGVESVNKSEVLTPEQKEDIFFNNAARFLRLSAEEISELKGP